MFVDKHIDKKVYPDWGGGEDLPHELTAYFYIAKKFKIHWLFIYVHYGPYAIKLEHSKCLGLILADLFWVKSLISK